MTDVIDSFKLVTITMQCKQSLIVASELVKTQNQTIKSQMKSLLVKAVGAITHSEPKSCVQLDLTQMQYSK